MAGEITLILGGARSGKSTFAESLALEWGGASGVTYIATADSRDGEMAYRIERHKSRRPPSWRTWEGSIDALPEAVGGMRGVLLLDCLTMYLTRLFLASPAAEGEDEAAWAEAERAILASVEEIFTNFADATKAADPNAAPSRLIAVSNEVGFGLVPPYLMGRRFRDMQGRANQLAAARADNAALVVAGLPMWLKGSGRGSNMRSSCTKNMWSKNWPSL